ncbi:MAG: biotin attachment protein [Desulfovibrio sp.]|jgi:biotin carboxyl carrier protein|nr:biotin attachment protein [Desulfovibrio sp.]
MLNISKLLDEIKAFPYREITVVAPHSGKIAFAEIEIGDHVHGPLGRWKEMPGTKLGMLERERNPKPICAPEKGEIGRVCKELDGHFVDAGTPLVILRHMLTSDEVQRIILQKALYLFLAPERAKYYFTPEADKKIRASDTHSVTVRNGMELFIMSRMKREVTLNYTGPDGVIYEVYFKYNENLETGTPLVGICPQDHLHVIQDMIMRVQTEWIEA